MIVIGMKISQESKTETVVIDTVMRPSWHSGQGIFSCLKNVAELIHEKVVTDIAPTPAVHVIILRRTHPGLGIVDSRDVVIGWTGSMMNNGAVQ